MARILLIEDYPAVARLVELVLAMEHHQVALAADGEEGLEKARGGGYDLVMLDVGLPKMDGWEVLELLRAEPSTAGIPVVVLTAHAEAADGVDGAAAVVVKPFNTAELLSAIASVLEGSVRAG
ncbi:MAG: response regulator transcription factor [Acidimicrobiia bacterium]